MAAWETGRPEARRKAGAAALGLALLLGACATAPAARPVPPPPAAAAPVSPALQATTWTYGTAEAAMLAEASFRALVDKAESRLGNLYFGSGFESAIVREVEGGRARMRDCDLTFRRPAVVFDIDETLVWNMGAQADQVRRAAAFDPKRWARWEKDGGDRLVAVPGAVAAVEALRKLGITPVFNSNRSAAHAAATVRALARLGLGEAVHGDTLWLEGDADGSSRKHARRVAIAERFCVLAQVGDQMGDFADAIDFAPDGSRRPPAERTRVAATVFGPLWGERWFLIPNPMYGRWNDPPLTLDDVVPEAARWTPKEETDALDP